MCRLSFSHTHTLLSGYERSIRRVAVNLPSSPDINAYWTWCENRSKFVLYNLEASVDIELSHLRGDHSLNLAHCTNRLPYTIDFTNMEQTRHGYGTKRKIQRCSLSTGTSLQSCLAFPATPRVPSTLHTPPVSSGGGTSGSSTMSLPNPFGRASLKSSGGSARTLFNPHLPTAHVSYTGVPIAIGTLTSGSTSSTASAVSGSNMTHSATNSMGYSSSPPKTRGTRNKTKSTGASSMTASGRGKRRGRGGEKGITGGWEGSGVTTKDDVEVALYAKLVRRRIKNADDEVSELIGVYVYTFIQMCMHSKLKQIHTNTHR